MKALLICPADRPAVACLAEHAPLAVAPLLGRSLAEYWLESLVALGVTHVTVLASDRPHLVRAVLGDGRRWGVRLEVLPESSELSVGEARAKYRPADAGDWHPQQDVVLMEHLPDHPEEPLFESYRAWFDAVQTYAPVAIAPTRIGVREIQPGVWAGLHAQISPRAKLQAPCWIGENTLVAADATVGPHAILEDRVVIEPGAQVAHSIVAPETFVGRMISLQHSIALGSTVVDWRNNSCLRVPDAFFLCSLSEHERAHEGASLPGRIMAGAAMIITFPIALIVMLLSLVRGENPLRLRLGVRPQRPVRGASLQTFAYYELTGGSNWLKRWPQFWNVMNGDLAWVGNRPLRPTQALSLANDFERLWLTAPVGLVSLADANGCTDGLNDEVCAHASYYAVNANRRMNWAILGRALIRAAAAIPVRPWSRRKPSAVALPRLVSKQES